MILKTLQWNIGGGKIRQATDDPADKASYCIDGFHHIIEHLKQLIPNIVTFQEMHADENISQIQSLAQQLSYPYCRYDVLEKSSHIDSKKQWGIGILSQYLLENPQFALFANPHWKIDALNGTTFDYGVEHSIVHIESVALEIINVHLPPFHRFNKDPLSEELAALREDYTKKIMPLEKRFLIQGDFNFNDASLAPFLPDLMKIAQEVENKEDTTPRGRRPDHVLYQGMKLKKSEIIKTVLTDHYAIYSEFEIEGVK